MDIVRLTDDDFAKIKTARENARKLNPIEDYADELAKEFYFDDRKKIFTPFENLNKIFSWRDSELTILAGYSGHGKSLITGQMIMNLVNQGHKCAIMSLEMPVRKTIGRMCQQLMEKNIPSPQDQAVFIKAMRGLYLFDYVGVISPQTVYAAVKLGVEKYGIKFFVVDSLMRCGVGEDGDSWMSKQKGFIEELCSLCKDTGVHIIMVAHMRKPDDSKGDHRIPNKYDIRGFSGITDQADNVMIFWRNKEKEQAEREGLGKHSDKPDAAIRLDKNRESGEEGLFGLKYNHLSRSYSAWIDKPRMLNRVG